MRTYLRKDLLLNHDFGMIVIHASSAGAIIPGPSGIMLFDPLNDLFFAIKMIGVNELVDVVMAKRAYYCGCIIHSGTKQQSIAYFRCRLPDDTRAKACFYR